MRTLRKKFPPWPAAVNPAKIYVEIPGELGWREYTLRELVYLWRTAQLPQDARYQEDDGVWHGVAELVDTISERERCAGISGAMADPTVTAAGRSSAARKSWIGLGLSLILLAAGLWAWPILRARHLASVAREEVEQESLDWERESRIEDRVKAGQVVPGMTPEQVRRSWGEPKVRKETADAARQQWVYRHEIVDFENGVVTGLETVAR